MALCPDPQLRREATGTMDCPNIFYRRDLNVHGCRFHDGNGMQTEEITKVMSNDDGLVVQWILIDIVGASQWPQPCS